MQNAITLENRVERERQAHDEDDVLGQNTRLKGRFPHTSCYPSKQRYFRDIADYMKGVKGLQVLDYGCGRGEMAMECLENGAAKVCGIDISQVYIEDCRQKAAAAGFEPERCDFRVMDAHKLEFPDNSFDLVAGFGILHHLDPDIALGEIQRVLRPGGRVIMHEPLADNPLLKLFRRLTPRARTEDERPFTGADLRRLTQRPGWKLEMRYCGLVEAPVAMVTSLLMPRNPNNFLLRMADWAEVRLNRLRFLQPWNQCVLFNMRKA
jgi:SAM-dependent methyltransferase